ncbi:Muramoyltetrapeptide carboxypeptidase [Mesoflavibacter sp. HG96]|uniref:LD-carboxypeptidase n=1 Tax=Mesoflavibacter profundi TaxID=2708110 RepID=A0ABT4S266_9FLAO|nr:MULTISPECIES: LD-carboxypeptidase [Mesoflavibacter]MDA0178166.1 LD-carboxypeptidase [Mesoflavibacter profundi]QIJ89127.1 Muramoyltetrapeptide carboxypeptidase [Mesoflavibacter sp. HG96]QIJ91855.1 Muramoyltetrapeptide carboxypeptidase [Mesoflavibacter sp. HG37]
MSKNRFIIITLLVFLFTGTNAMISQNVNFKNPTENLIQPPYLKAGDTVAIVAPSGILKHRNEEVERAKRLLKQWNLNVVVGKHVFNQANHFAGTDQERCEDFQNALDNPNIKAIWCARGGYGTVRILDKLDYTKFLEQPKWIIGYSDITALHNQIHNLGVQSLHAMMCVSLPKDESEVEQTIATFKKAIFGETLSYTLEGSKYNQTGEVRAPIVGGNLTMLHTMLGSKTSVDTSGKILFIEEIGEYKYHIDRMLQSLKRAGYFDHCKGVIVGDMTKLRKNTTLWGTSIEQLILDALADYDFPIAFNMPAGHEEDNRALILGRNATLKVEKTKSTLVFE